MKIFNTLSWIIVILGFLLKLIHFSSSNLIFIFGVLLISIYAILNLFIKKMSDPENVMFHISLMFLTQYALFRFMYWPCGPKIFGFPTLFMLGFISSMVWFSYFYKNRLKFKWKHYFFMLYFIGFILLSYTHSHRIYYFHNLSFPMNGHTRLYTYYAWDTYSWFLYIGGETSKALYANFEAQQAYIRYTKRENLPIDENIVQKLKEHENKIIEKTWYDLEEVKH